MSARGTKRFTPKRDMTFSGEKFKKMQEERKKELGDRYVTMGRGTRKVKISDIKETKVASAKGRYISKCLDEIQDLLLIFVI